MDGKIADGRRQEVGRTRARWTECGRTHNTFLNSLRKNAYMRDEFERDLAEYLSARKRAGRIDIKSFLKKLMPERKVEDPTVAIPEQVEVYTEPQPVPKQPSFISKIFKKEVVNEELVREHMRADDALDDMKEVAKIALSMIKQLPDEQLRLFKNSPDFERLKTLLKKHDLIK